MDQQELATPTSGHDKARSELRYKRMEKVTLTKYLAEFHQTLSIYKKTTSDEEQKGCTPQLKKSSK